MITITEKYFNELDNLQSLYKQEIGEAAPDETDFKKMHDAIQNGAITFYGAIQNEHLVGMCSVSKTFSTFNYASSGVLEDFYILPEYRHKGIARELVRYAYAQSGVSSMTVGCADCDAEMYKALGFCIELGNMLAFDV